MRRLTAVMVMACAALPAFGFQQEKPKKPTPQEKAVELLSAASEAAPGAQPEVAATALMRIGENYEGLDDRKALEAMKSAFAVSLGIPPSDDARKQRVQVLVASAAAQVSLPDAVEMLKQIEPLTGEYDPRQEPIKKIVERMIEKKQFDQAIEALNSVGVVGQYPYAGMGIIYEKLPKQDLRRPQVFGAAFAAYALRPAEPFSQFIEAHWKELPRSTAEAAVGAIVTHILSYKSDEYLLQTIATEKGVITLRSRQDVELFDIMHVLRVFDKKRYEEVLETHPELKAALARFPEGRAGMGQLISLTRTYDTSPEPVQSVMKSGETGAQLGRVMGEVGKLFQFDLPDDVVEKNFMKALELIKTITDPAERVEMLSSIASAAGDDAAITRPILADCMEILKDIKDPDATVGAWTNIAEVAHQIGDDKLTGEALDHLLDNAAALLKRDMDPDAPNMGLRDQWPSTNAYRRTAISAVKAFGVDAEWISGRIADPDMALYARVEMAQALLDKPHTDWSKSYSPKKK
jgi:hypothetical protein